MKKKLLILVAGLFMAVTAFANLGENDAQMTARYGQCQAQEKDVNDGLETKCYQHAGLWIRVRFLEGGSASEAFVRLDRGAFTENEKAGLLDTNRLGSTWTRIYRSADVERWILGSNGAVANYYIKKKVLIITSRGMMRHIPDSSRLKEKE